MLLSRRRLLAVFAAATVPVVVGVAAEAKPRKPSVSNDIYRDVY
jgi:hypothetical protein